MLKFKFILIIVYVGTCIYCSNNKFKGKITNDQAMTLNNVKLIDDQGEIITKSDCNGKFKLKAKIGDTLILKKTGFKDQVVVLNKNKKLEFTLLFDYKNIQKTLSKEYPKNYGEGSGQPIYIVDGVPSFNNSNKIIDKEDVNEMKVIKGELATNLFGKHALNGVILINTCISYN